MTAPAGAAAAGAGAEATGAASFDFTAFDWLEEQATPQRGTTAIAASPNNLLRITPPVLGSFRFRCIQALHDVAKRLDALRIAHVLPEHQFVWPHVQDLAVVE